MGLHLWQSWGHDKGRGSEACLMCTYPRRSKKALHGSTSGVSGRPTLEWIKTHTKCQAKQKGFSIYVWDKKLKSGKDSPHPLALWEAV